MAQLTSEAVSEYKSLKSEAEINNRKDLGYSSEVNSCDGVQEIISLKDDMKPDFINEKDITCISALKHELEQTKQSLQRKTLECEQACHMRNKLEAELEDLTTSLFEEANKMVYDANLKRHKAEKKLAVAEGKNEALETEIEALKSLVITSTPSNPNPTSHPQLIKKSEVSPTRKKPNVLAKFMENHKKEKSCVLQELHSLQANTIPAQFPKRNSKVDKRLFDQASHWHQNYLHLSESENNNSNSFCNCSSLHAEPSECLPLSGCKFLLQSEFMSKIFKDDISPCLSFSNKDLSSKVSDCIHRNSLSVELDKTLDSSSVRLCSLSETESQCKHRIRLDDSEDWFSISRPCRNRITSVCDFFTYLRYIKQGIVKHDSEQAYWEITRLRMEMCLARLGYDKEA